MIEGGSGMREMKVRVDVWPPFSIEEEFRGGDAMLFVTASSKER